MGSYSIKGHAYVSHTSGRQYAFERSRTGDSRKNALAKMFADDKAFATAAAAQKPITPAPSDHASRVAEVVHAERPTVTVVDGIGSRVAILERQLTHTRNAGDRASIQRKINALSGRQATEIQKAEAAAVHQSFLESDEWLKATADAFARHEELALSNDGDLPAQLCKDAYDSREALRRSPTPEGIAAYRERETKLREDYQAGRQHSINVTKARIAQLELDARMLLLAPQAVLPSEQMTDVPDKPTDLYYKVKTGIPE
jgi:hypothetical protein